jgi:hypothetical protein
MKHRLSSLLLGVVWLLGILPADMARGQGPGDRGQLSGQQLLAEAVRRVDQEPSLAADVRYRVDAFGQQLLGTGRYLQSGAGQRRQLRLDLRMQVQDRPATLVEIRGTDEYWIRREVPPVAATLGRVDLAQLRRATRRSEAPAGEEALPRGAWIMLGGLPRLLVSLNEHFEFGSPKTDEVQIALPGGQVQRLPIWVLEGRWKPARLAALAGKSGGSLPEQLPERVQVVLDRSDSSLPLFPYRVTYFRTASEQDAARSIPAGRELMTLELFNVRRVGQIDAREFKYESGEQEVLDLTAAYVQQHAGGAKLR